MQVQMHYFLLDSLLKWLPKSRHCHLAQVKLDNHPLEAYRYNLQVVFQTDTDSLALVFINKLLTIFNTSSINPSLAEIPPPITNFSGFKETSKFWIPLAKFLLKSKTYLLAISLPSAAFSNRSQKKPAVPEALLIPF